MFAVAVASLWLRWQRRLFSNRWFLRALVVMTPSGLIATIGGWYLAETGRQPWVIWGILKTADSVSPVPANAILTSLIALACVYAVFLVAFIVYVLRVIRRGPERAPEQVEPTGSLKPALTASVMQPRPAE